MNSKTRLKGKNKQFLNDNFCLTYWKIFDISLFGRGMNEVLKIVEGWIESEAKNKWIATVNPEFVMKSLKDDEFRQILRETDLNVVDGVGLLWARELNKKFPISNFQFPKKIVYGLKVGGEIIGGKHREGLVSGSDLMPELCRLASKKEYKVFFLGGFGDRAKRTVEYFRSQMSDFRCQFSEGEPDIKNEEVIKQINKFKPDILFVAYGMKKQEEWIRNHLDKIEIGVAIGVGRSFDYYSGDLKRAPALVRKMGMEWLYSLIKEPKRIKRQVVLPKFVWKVLNQ